MKKVTIFGNFSKFKERLTLDEILNRFKIGIYAYIIRVLRQLLKNGDKTGYDRMKNKLDGVTFSASFLRFRKQEFAVDYTGLIILDFDWLSEALLATTRDIIEHCEYTLACFLSPSGQGLKVLVQVSTGIEDHLPSFNSVAFFYETITGVKIDRSGKDVTRLCFVTFDPALYQNKAARIFVPTKESGQKWTSPVPVIPVLKGGQNLPAGKNRIEDLYQKCITYIARYVSYTEGHRHEFVLKLTNKLRKVGFSEFSTASLIHRDYNFNDREVSDIIKSVYSYNIIYEAPKTPFKGNNGAAGHGPKKAQPAAQKKGKRKNADSDTLVAELPGKSTHDGDKNDPMGGELPDASPKPGKKTGKQLYDLEVTEDFLTHWYEMRYNEVTGVVEWRKRGSRKPFKRLEDHDENSMFRRLHHAGQKIPIHVLHVILSSDYSPVFNPFTHYFKKLPKWDGVTDYIGQLSATVKTTDDNFWFYCFPKWFVAYVASMIYDDVVNNTVIVFTGDQGIGKSSWFKLLVPNALRDYLGTAALQTDSKDTAIQISECALIILDEMESLSRKDLFSVKELITRPRNRIRRPYGRNSDNLPHRASFIAAVNSQQVLSDITGSRRYLCFSVISIEYQHTVDIDRALAQAYSLVKEKFMYWFDQDQIKVLTESNEDFTSKSIEEELIILWLRVVTRDEWDARKLTANGDTIKNLTATQIGLFLMEKAKFVLTDNTIVKIGKIMKKLGFERIKRSNNYCYLLRTVDKEVVEQGTRTMDDDEVLNAEQVANEQIIMLEEDMTNSFDDNNSPFDV